MPASIVLHGSLQPGITLLHTYNTPVTAAAVKRPLGACMAPGGVTRSLPTSQFLCNSVLQLTT
jgi:hypothetical protein